MNKQQVILVHQTLFRLRLHLKDLGILEGAAFEDYDRLGVLPTYVHVVKSRHARAVVELVKGLELVAHPDKPTPYDNKRGDRL